MSHRRFSRTNLRDRRKDAGLTLEELATAIGRSWSSIYAYERGRVTPPTDALPMLAFALGCEIDDFFESPELLEVPS